MSTTLACPATAGSCFSLRPQAPVSEIGKIAFVFSGLGRFHQAMAAYEALQEIPFFRTYTESFADALGGVRPKDRFEDVLGHRICTVVQYGLAGLLKAMGIPPHGLVGHSAGEVAAALAAGLISEKDAARLVRAHETVMEKALGKGRMLVAGLDSESAASRLSGKTDIWLSVENSPQSVVFSGKKPGTIDDLEAALDEAGVFVHPLVPEIPFHSPILEPFIPDFQANLTGLRHDAAAIPCWSSFLKRPLKSGEATPEYWARHICEPVAFADTFAAMVADGYGTFIEIAPRTALALAMVQGAEAAGAPVRIVETLKGEKEAVALSKGLFDRLRDSGFKPNPSVLGIRVAQTDRFEKRSVDRAAVAETMAACLAEATEGRIPDLEAARDGFFAAGMNSLMAMRFRELLEKALDRHIPVTLLLDCPTPERLIDALCMGETASSPLSGAPSNLSTGEEAVAIVGMACRFPGGSSSPGRFWDRLVSGTHCFEPVPDSRFDTRALCRPVAALLEGESVWAFDPGFFRLPEKEARAMDPQHRLLLETLVEAIEDGGIAKEALTGTQTGVFVGMSTDDFKSAHMAVGETEQVDPYTATGALFSTAAGRIAHWLDLHGPVMTLDTACSSALVAVHQAVRSLLDEETETALACGVNAVLSPNLFACLNELGILSSAGDCRVFDTAADGYVRGEGCGVVVLKRLSRALEDGDPIRAVIRGSAVNHDGRSASLTAPNGRAQEAVVRSALKRSGLPPEAVCMVEAHGTGTAMGDPVEMAALGRVFGRDRHHRLWVGSAKSVIGHLEPVAGMAGLIKAVLCLEKKQVPPQRGYETPNAQLDVSGPLAIPKATVSLESAPTPVAGVSSFGFSGTNAHVLVEAAPVSEFAIPSPSIWRVLPLSAHHPDALNRRMADVASWLEENPNGVDALCRTFARGRWHHPYRTAVQGEDAATLARALRQGPVISPKTPAAASCRRLGFLFSGQGSQMPRMGASLYYASGAFRRVMDLADTVCAPFLDTPLSALIYGKEADADALSRTRLAQPALFAVAMGMAAHWAHVGLRPKVVMGHSLGELMAACCAGVFSLESGIRLAAIRGQLMDEAGEGGMAAVRDTDGRIESLLAGFPGISIAAWNTPEQVVISGPLHDLQNCCRFLDKQGLRTQMLAVSHAFHSPLMEAAAAEFARAVAEEKRHAPNIPVVCNLSGETETARLTDPAYWREQMLSPVRFHQSVKSLADFADVFLEIGPKATLLPMARKCLADRAETVSWIPAWDSKKGGENIAITVAAAWNAGLDIDWQAVYPGPRVVRDPGLPDFASYPFLHRVLRPTPAGSVSEAVHPVAEVAQNARNIEAPDADTVNALYRELDEIAALSVLASIGPAGGLDTDRFISENQLKAQLGVQAQFMSLLRALSRQMAARDKIRMENGSLIPLLSPEAAEAEAKSRLSAFRQHYPDMAGVADLVDSCCKALPEVLSGRIDPLPLLFPQGGLDHVACVYRGQRVADYFNRLTASGVREAVRMLRSRRGISEVRILEIGAGTGATTEAVLAALAGEHRVRYHFTDVSPFFLKAAERRFAGSSVFFSTGLLDIETEPLSQGVDAGEFHVVVATGVLHATRRLPATLKHVRTLLAPEGVVLVNEPVRAYAYLTPVFGLTDGWWRFGDEAGRIPDSPLIACGNWPARLREAGLDPVETLSLGNESPQAVFVAAASDTLACTKAESPIEEQPMETPNARAADPNTDRHPLAAELKQLVADASGIPVEELIPEMSLFSLGIDSLMLIQVRRQMAARFGAAPEMRQFYEETDSLDKIADWLAENGSSASARPSSDAPPRSLPETAASVPDSMPPGAPAQPVPGDMASLMAAQLQTMQALMETQLAVMAGGNAAAVSSAAPELSPVKPATPEPSASKDSSPQTSSVPHIRLFQLDGDPLTPKQAAFVTDLVTRFGKKTGKSRNLAQKGRPVLSDWINSLGFRKTLKEIVYPVAVDSASGPRFTDVDGNTYIDMAMGYGVSFFGNNPAFIAEAVHDALSKGCCLGPQTPLAAEAAEGISRLTGAERVAFCNTGSEAVMAALRIARAVTGRKAVVLFSGSYHGTFDGVLATVGEGGAARPAAPGTLPSMVADVRVLAYGKPESLGAIRQWKDELAAVLVEPVQSRNPSLQPVEFLKELRQITEDCGTALIFDEVLTGFRIHPGGCAHDFGIRPDLSTYGKIAGGGMPLGVVAGKARFMDYVDGGFWDFGDASTPKDKLVTFAGTFCKHPLAMAAACAVLRRMSVEGPALQERVNRLTDDLAFRINTFCRENDFAMRVRHYASVFRFEPFGRYSLALNPLEPELFFRLLMDKGVYTWEKRICFLSAAHGPDEVDAIVAAVKESLLAMREGGFAFEGRLENEAEIVPPSTTPHRLPVLAAQKAQYAFSRIPGAESASHVNAAWRVRGAFDPDRMAAAFRNLLRRHDALRLSFDTATDGVTMTVMECDAVKPEIVRVVCTEADIDSRLKAFIRPFELERPPLVRLFLAELGETDHLLALDAHHIAVDGWSLNLLVRDLMALYEDQILPPVPPFGAAPALEASYRNSDQWETDRNFWRSHLLPLPDPADLPSPRLRPEVMDHGGEHLNLSLEGEEMQRLLACAKHLGVSPFVFFFSVFRLFLYRLTGQADTVVGLPAGGRHSEETEKMVGMFANLLPLRIAVDPEEDFPEFCRRVARESRTALDHGRMPYTDLVEQLLESRDPGRNPFYDVMFIYEDGRDREPETEGLDIRPWPIARDASAVDLTLEVVRGANGLHLRLEYRRALWDKTDMDVFAKGFLSVAGQVAENHLAPLSTLGLMTPEQERDMFSSWNPPRSRSGCTDLLAALERPLTEGPDRPALVAGAERLSYRQLHARADRIARFLVHHKGVRPGDRVGLLCPRDDRLLCALLGIIKSGGAYVPADTGHPVQRTRRVMEDAGIKVLLVGNEADMPAFSSLPCHCLSDIGPTSEPLTQVRVSPEDPAYVIYTSGSTGAPKGVAVSHQSVATFCRNLPERFGMGPDTRMLAVTTVTFDISVLELHGVLAAGGCVVLAEDRAVKRPEAVLSLMEEEAVTAFQTTPSYFRRLLEAEGGAQTLSRRKVLLVGGESLPDDLRQRLCALSGPVAYNVYGPTEATVWATARKLDHPEANSVGTPLVNAEVMVLTSDGCRLQPPGIPGEIAIGGDGVALGYVNMPEKTRQAFIPHPLDSGRTVYRTGDRGYLDAVGELHCLGRRDGQLKIRGYRVETGEVAAVLERQPGVRQAVVDVRRVDGHPVLCAWLCSEAPAERAVLVDALADELPAYMIPAFFISVDRMPETPNGKVDVRGLPDPVTRDWRAKAADPVVVERVMALWRELLHTQDVIHISNFFALGGDSIQAMRLVGRLGEWGVPLTVKDIFRYPTPEALASHLCRSGHRPAFFAMDPPGLVGNAPDPVSEPASSAHCLQLDDEDMADLFGEADDNKDAGVG